LIVAEKRAGPRKLHGKIIGIFHGRKISERKGTQRSACFVKYTENSALTIHNRNDQRVC
jgi:hypothetical protein